MKTVPAVRRRPQGALDISVYPISYAGGEVPELNIALIPGLVNRYKEGSPGKTPRSGRRSTRSSPTRAWSSVMDLAGGRGGQPGKTR